MFLDFRSPDCLYVDPTGWPRALVVFIHRTDSFGGVFAAQTDEQEPADESPGDPKSVLGSQPCSAFLIQPYDKEGLFAEIGCWRFLIESWAEKQGPFVHDGRIELVKQDYDLTINLHGAVTIQLRNGSTVMTQIPGYDPQYVPRVVVDEDDYKAPTRYERLIGEDLLVNETGYESG